MGKISERIFTGISAMLIVGVTGSFGTGKSTVSAMLKSYGAVVIDADEVTKAIIEKNGKCYKKVAKLFSGAILPSGKLDRRVLAEIVFNDPRELSKLTKVLYPEAFKQIKQQIKKFKDKDLIVLDVPLLFEAEWDRLSDINIVVTASKKVQLIRLKNKWGLSDKEIRLRLKAQMPLSQKKQRADIVINNNESLEKTQQQVKAIVERLKRIKV